MTTVAYRDGCIAADTSVNQSGTHNGCMIKIARNEAGDLAGVCGYASFAGDFLEWFKDKEEGKAPVPKTSKETVSKGIIVRAEDGRIEVWEDGDHFVINADYYAMGSGTDIAYGAMYMDATAAEAVAAAIKHDAHTSGDVKVLYRESTHMATLVHPIAV